MAGEVDCGHFRTAEITDEQPIPTTDTLRRLMERHELIVPATPGM